MSKTANPPTDDTSMHHYNLLRLIEARNNGMSFEQRWHDVVQREPNRLPNLRLVRTWQIDGLSYAYDIGRRHAQHGLLYASIDHAKVHQLELAEMFPGHGHTTCLVLPPFVPGPWEGGRPQSVNILVVASRSLTNQMFAAEFGCDHDLVITRPYIGVHRYTCQRCAAQWDIDHGD